MHRVILDRSIFHGDKFSLLKQSRLQWCIRHNLLKVLYTSRFIEETLQFGFINEADFKMHLDFLIDLNASKWFRSPEDIVAIELGDKVVGRKYYFLSANEIQNLAHNSYQLPNNLVPTIDRDRIIEEIQHNKSLRQQFRRTRLDARNSVPYQAYDFNQYFEDHVEWYIENALMKIHSNSANFLDTWRRRRPQCRFAESFMRAWFSTLFLPIIDHQLKLDVNDKLDAEQLAYLEWAHIIVSDDTNFMKAAFNLLYGHTSKTYFSLTDFLTYLANVAATAPNRRNHVAPSVDRRG